MKYLPMQLGINDNLCFHNSISAERHSLDSFDDTCCPLIVASFSVLGDNDMPRSVLECTAATK